MLENVYEGINDSQKCAWRLKCSKMCMKAQMSVPKWIYQKCIFVKCTRLACLLSFANLLSYRPCNFEMILSEFHKVCISLILSKALEQQPQQLVQEQWQWRGQCALFRGARKLFSFSWFSADFVRKLFSFSWFFMFFADFARKLFSFSWFSCFLQILHVSYLVFHGFSCFFWRFCT